MPKLNTVLIANRGEIAVRIAKTLRRMGIRSIAVYSDPDRSSPHVALADVAIHLPGTSAAETYLRGDLIIGAARANGADAIIPGYGFLAENADFAEQCEAAGLAFVGPTPDQIRRAVAFARKARAFLRVELDNEWGSAGPRDALYRDASFYCGAGRVSCVVSASGELMPCTTTDVDESAGSIRNERLSRLWTKGFSSFRRQHQDTDRDPRDCWLQTRHGCSCRPSAFGDLDIESELRALMRSES